MLAVAGTNYQCQDSFQNQKLIVLQIRIHPE